MIVALKRRLHRRGSSDASRIWIKRDQKEEHIDESKSSTRFGTSVFRVGTQHSSLLLKCVF